MKSREHGTDDAAEAGRARFRTLPERIRPEQTSTSLPASPAGPARGSFSQDDWLARNVWCGTLL
ncbi:hypothetical protein [Kitasatospora sp. NPDC005748]|uniref:hypothetical protein n=1 Tax=Kitasatospora sp. NPDC005748 TaxID=3157063 RepID=UPI0033F8DBF2